LKDVQAYAEFVATSTPSKPIVKLPNTLCSGDELSIFNLLCLDSRAVQSVIASAARQSQHNPKQDCFAALAMTALSNAAQHWSGMFRHVHIVKVDIEID
jgi:hypothetical protein